MSDTSSDDPTRPIKFRDAAAVVLIRGSGDALQVFWVLRSQAVPFMPGFHAFVGGGVSKSDAELELEIVDEDPEHRPPPGSDLGRGRLDSGEHLRLLRACAIREAFEETGVLVGLAEPARATGLGEARKRLLAGEVSFPELAKSRGWRFRADQLRFGGRWTTPAFAEVRFDTVFFLARVPEGMTPEIQPGELESGEWIAPHTGIDRWKRGEATFAAPILYTLREIDKGEADLSQRLSAAPLRAGQPVRRVELKWGIVLQAMKTRPLPPATRTNAYLVGEKEMALIDPGSNAPDELEALDRLIELLAAEGRRLVVVLLTHAHPDHVGGARAVAERYGVPIGAHDETARALEGELEVERVLRGAETIALAGPNDWTLRVLHTPGHAPGHLCFVHERTRSLFCGDQLTGGRSTVMIDPPEGNMAAYLASLEDLLSEPVETLFPAHGSPTGAAKRRIRWMIEHRLLREAKVVAVLSKEPLSVGVLVARAYDDTPQRLWPYAERSLLAHLIKLENEGRAIREGERWRTT